MPASRRARTASSKRGNGVSGRQPRSITSAPSRRYSAARATISSMPSNGASTISANRRVACRFNSTGAGRSPNITGKSLTSTGPRVTGTASRRDNSSKSPRQRPGTMTRSTDSSPASRRCSICAVINAATLTPIFLTSWLNPSRRMPASVLCKRRSASFPVTKRMCSLIMTKRRRGDGSYQPVFGVKSCPPSFPRKRESRKRALILQRLFFRIPALRLQRVCAGMTRRAGMTEIKSWHGFRFS